MESVQPRADAATRYGPLTATTAVQSAGNARREAAAQPGKRPTPPATPVKPPPPSAAARKSFRPGRRKRCDRHKTRKTRIA